MARDIPTLNAAPAAPPVRAENCMTCRWSGLDQTGKGQVCRKRPPVAILGMQVNVLTQKPEQGMFSLWPPVTQADWCAEFGAKLSS